MKDNINTEKDFLTKQESNPELVAQVDNIIDVPFEEDISAEDLSEIEAIQAAIEQGDEPIEDVETAAGEEGSNGGFDVVDVSRNATETIASTDFKTASFSFNSSSVNITDTNIFNADNSSPVLGEDDSITIAENTTAVGSYAATDAENVNITYTLSGPALIHI